MISFQLFSPLVSHLTWSIFTLFNNENQLLPYYYLNIPITKQITREKKPRNKQTWTQKSSSNDLTSIQNEIREKKSLFRIVAQKKVVHKVKWKNEMGKIDWCLFFSLLPQTRLCGDCWTIKTCIISTKGQRGWCKRIFAQRYFEW